MEYTLVALLQTTPATFEGLRCKVFALALEGVGISHDTVPGADNLWDDCYETASVLAYLHEDLEALAGRSDMTDQPQAPLEPRVVERIKRLVELGSNLNLGVMAAMEVADEKGTIPPDVASKLATELDSVLCKIDNLLRGLGEDDDKPGA